MNKYDIILEWLNNSCKKDNMNKEVEMIQYPDGSINYFFPTGQVVSYQSIEEIKTVQLAPLQVPKTNKGTKPMYNENFNQAQLGFNYLVNRAADAHSIQNRELQKTFGMVNDEQPRTAEELINRVLAGKYILKDSSKEVNTSRPADYVIWRDPSVKEDKAGYEAATKELDKQYTITKDAVMSGVYADGLKAVNDLAAWTPTSGNAS